MTTTRNVLLIEGQPEVGAPDADRLTAAGHLVRRCYPTPDPAGAEAQVDRRDLCVGVTTGSCPLDDGVDVALLVRRRLATQPAAREGGVSCALRAGVPVVEHGPDLLDPYEPWLTGRVTGDVVAACESAVRVAHEPLRRAVEERLESLLMAADVEPAVVSCTLELQDGQLRMLLAGPAIAPRLAQSLAVHALDVVRASGRTHRRVNVSYAAAATT